MAMESAALPLAGVRVLDWTDGTGAMCSRLLGDLGAEVLLVEQPGGMPFRSAHPILDGDSVPFTVVNANKRRVEIDWRQPTGRKELLALAADADIVVTGQTPATLDGAGLGVEAFHERNPRLVVTSITDFGCTGPYRDWVATDWVHLALSSVLSRSGGPGRPPLMPPGRLAQEHAAAQALWVTLVAYWSAQVTGRGEHVDLSVFEATTQSFDAAFGIGGTATGGVPAARLPQGRADMSFLYPIFPCADGHVRICLLARRQWRAMFGWLGEPPEFADPKYDATRQRFADRDRLYPLMALLFSGHSQAALVADGQRRGIPIEAVKDPSGVLRDEHFGARGTWTEVKLGSGRTGVMANGVYEINGERAGIRELLDESDNHTGFTARIATDAAGRMDHSSGEPPLSGLRVLDLGVIVVGAESGRLFADLGADVIKVESSAFPDGSRASSGPGTVNASFAWGHRNKRSLGIDLRTAKGREIFLGLVSVSDVVLSNFRPGTMESLGLGSHVLRDVNPALVVVESSAMGQSGPASRRMGYGPLVRAATGLSSLWRYPQDASSFCDAITVYPDHTAARIGAAGALAALIMRRATGEGSVISVAQAEIMLTQFAAEFLLESLEPGSLTPVGNSGATDAPYGVFPCTGDDQWCVITVRGNEDWKRLCLAIGAHDLRDDISLGNPTARVSRRTEINERVTAWTTGRSPDEAMTALQEAGVPAGAMLRPHDLLTNEQLTARDFFTVLSQPHVGDLPTESSPARFNRLRVAGPGPAPLLGEHTREIVKELLKLSAAETQQLLDEGALEEQRREPK